jgi:hypothetical protein
VNLYVAQLRFQSCMSPYVLIQRDASLLQGTIQPAVLSLSRNCQVTVDRHKQTAMMVHYTNTAWLRLLLFSLSRNRAWKNIHVHTPLGYAYTSHLWHQMYRVDGTCSVYKLHHSIVHNLLLPTPQVGITIILLVDSDPLMSCVRAIFRCIPSSKASWLLLASWCLLSLKASG